MPIPTRKLSLLKAFTLLVFVVRPDLAASLGPDTSFGLPTVVPATEFLTPRKSQSFYRRSLVGENIFNPRSSVVVEYENENSPTGALVSFDTSETPIVVVGTFDSLLKSIECTPSLPTSGGFSTIYIQLDSPESVDEASKAWRSFRRLNLLTSHSGCNFDNEFGAWRVYDIETNLTAQHIRLVAESISLHRLGAYNILLLGQSMRGVLEPGTIHDDLARRETFNPTYNNDFSGLEIISANTSSLPSSLQDELGSANLNILCLECSVGFDFTVDVNITVSDFSVTTMTITATVNNFNQTILLGFSVGATGLSFSHDRDLFNIPLTPLAIRDLLSIGPEVGISAGLQLNLTGAMNFTMGAKATIDPGAFAAYDFLKQTESDKGWNTAKFEIIPLRLLGGTLNSTLTMNISPFIGVGITLPFGDEPLIEARLSQSAPDITFSANMTENVNRNCEPITDNDFESFPIAFQLAGEMTFGTQVGLVGDLTDLFSPWDEEFPHGNFSLFNQTGESGNGTSSCFVVVDNSVTSTNATSPSILTAAPTGTLMAAASATPSFDVSKIQSYFSANGQLPTNVDYSQLVQATTVPDDIKQAIQGVAATSTPSSPGKSATLKSDLGFLYIVSSIIILYFSVSI